MHRIQVQLREDQVEALRRLAQREDDSIAGVIRGAVDAYLEREDQARRSQRAVDAIGGFRSGRSDVSARHDDALAEDFAR